MVEEDWEDGVLLGRLLIPVVTPGGGSTRWGRGLSYDRGPERQVESQVTTQTSTRILGLSSLLFRFDLQGREQRSYLETITPDCLCQ